MLCERGWLERSRREKKKKKGLIRGGRKIEKGNVL